MKILAIRGKNCASLAGEFAVDFDQEPLKSAGLFAICGSTGSGKSTLLDTLCMALYENTPRLLKAGNSRTLPDGGDFVTHQDAANLLRRGCADGYAEVDFVGNDGKAYRSRWSVRRSRGRVTGSLQPTVMVLTSLPEQTPIGGTKSEVKYEIVQRLGLSFEQFTRAVLLAQNEFSGFLKADDNERGELLETLTGSRIYSLISQRAFARARLEQANLQRITDRLADQSPLSDEARQQLDQQLQTVSAAVAVLEQRQATLETQLRWYQNDAKLLEQQSEAEQQLQRMQQKYEQAAPRRALLQQVESVQSARPLLEQTDRLAHSMAMNQQAWNQAQEQLQHDKEQGRLTSVALEQAHQGLHQAEQHQRDAAPLLDQAKALDARLDALLPELHKADEAKQVASTTVLTLTRQVTLKQAGIQQTEKKQRETRYWLASHAGLQELADHWSGVEQLLAQAATGKHELAGLEQRLLSVVHNDSRLTTQLAQASTALTAATTALEQAEQRVHQAQQQLTLIDVSQLEQDKRQTDTRREQLASAEQLWRTLQEQTARLDQWQSQSRQIEQASAQADASLNRITTQLPLYLSAQTEAELLLKHAQAACAETTEALRAALEPQVACPVCGSQQHPYVDDDHPDVAEPVSTALAPGAQPRLYAMLKSMQDQVAKCREQVRVAYQQQATHHAEVGSCKRQAASMEQQRKEGQLTLNQHHARWQEHPLREEVQGQLAAQSAAQDAMPLTMSPEGVPEGQSESNRNADIWWAEQHAIVRQGQHALAQRDAAWRSALSARDSAQITLDRTSQTYHAIKQQVSGLQSDRLQLTTEQQFVDQRRHECQQQLVRILEQLAPYFQSSTASVQWDAADESVDVGLYDPELQSQATEQLTWREDWQDNPHEFHAQCAHNVQLWQANRNAAEQGQRQHTTLSGELSVLMDALQQAQQAQQRTDKDFDARNAVVTAMQAQRQLLFDGRPVQQYEQQLTEARSAAKVSLEQCTKAAISSKNAEIRSTEVIAQLSTRLTAEQAESEAAAQRLAHWMASAIHLLQCPSEDEGQPQSWPQPHQSHQQQQPLQQQHHHLRTLLAYTDDWIIAERTAQQADAASLERAATVQQERQRQRQAHHEVAPDGALDILQHNLQALTTERNLTQAELTQCQLALRIDQQRRVNAADLLQEIDSQATIQRMWAQMNDLIGAADGKKFRNYAQQTTLDVLLGYANRHLMELSRRYRLQRISMTLALMVVDQDMGDEMRSVHSLSGGESFLVSLALALGLASLSSNRVRVESLFIDEGFGSLDADTLRVAMDALDGLQSQGRKVGVISHVQEMTERISTKVLIHRGAGGKSSVVVA